MRKATLPANTRHRQSAIARRPRTPKLTHDDHRQPTTTQHEAQDRRSREQCADCGAALVEDQRYCLQCGARRGKPRLDFTRFLEAVVSDWTRARARWSTGIQHAASAAGAGSSQAAVRGRRRDALAPSRRRAGGACSPSGSSRARRLGPAPSSSPADAATLAQRALAALVAQASGSPPASAATSSTATPPESATATTAARARAPNHKAAAKAASATLRLLGKLFLEANLGTPSSEGSSSEGSLQRLGQRRKTHARNADQTAPDQARLGDRALGRRASAPRSQSPTIDPYLAKQLVPKGTLLSNYTLSASSALANGIALLSGQSVNLDTEQNCPTYSELQPPTVNATTGLAEGVGCVYPATVKTLADELTAGGAHVEGVRAGHGRTRRRRAAGLRHATSATPSSHHHEHHPEPPGTSCDSQATPSRTSTGTSADHRHNPGGRGVTCRRPELGAADPNHTPAPGDPYLTFRNPFVYFHSLLDGGACASNDVDLGQLQGDLATPADTPSLSWIVPSACNDGSSTPCAPGAPAGLAPADDFLKEVVPQILATSRLPQGRTDRDRPRQPTRPRPRAPRASPSARCCSRRSCTAVRACPKASTTSRS